jgi:hypothetical protein
MATSILTSSVHSNLAQTIQQEIVGRTAKYYFALGRNYSWGTTNDNPIAAEDYIPFETQTRKDFIKYSEIGPSDISIVIERTEWQAGFIYDDYDLYTTDNVAYSGATSLETSAFYVVTDEFNVYKCLCNNENSASLNKPTGTQVAPIGPLVDGYVWKFMYNIPLYLRNKFLSATQMPVTTVLTSQYYGNGALTNISVENKGSGYSLNTILTGNVHSDLTVTIPNLKKLYGTDTLFTTQIGSYTGSPKMIKIGDMLYIVASVQSNTELTLTTFAYVPSSTQFTLIKTLIEVTGDGRRADNPTVLSSVSIVTAGTLYTVNAVVVFSDPTLPNGRRAKGHPTIVSGNITGIVIDDPGYGYVSPPSFTVTDLDGYGVTGYCNSTYTSALIEPVINANNGEIQLVTMTNAGEGYTQATAIVRSLNNTGTGALITLNTTINDLDSKQSTQELLASNGAINIIKMINKGNGYVSATVTIIGDGSGCIATPVIVNGRIEKILIANNDGGSHYTNASVVITSEGNNTASARAIISPLGGHGKNAINELFGRTVLFYGRVKEDIIKTVPITNYYRQVTLIKKPKSHNNLLTYNGFSGTSCYVVSSSDVISGNFNVGDIVFASYNSNRYKFRIIGKYSRSLLLSAIDNSFDPIIGSVMLKVTDATSYTSAVVGSFTITSVNLPDINRFSGDVIYIDNRQPFKASPEQIITISSRFKI